MKLQLLVLDSMWFCTQFPKFVQLIFTEGRQGTLSAFSLPRTPYTSYAVHPEWCSRLFAHSL